MKKSQITDKTDPPETPARKRSMLHHANVEPAVPDTALDTLPGLRAGRRPGAAMSRAARSGGDGPVADWVAEMVLIRRDRCEASFAALFRHFAPRLKAFLMRSGLDPALSEEVVQDVMQTVWRKADQFDPTRASVSTWIYTIARNRRIDVLRRHARPEPEDLPWGPAEEPDQAEVIGLQQESETLRAALKTLPDKQRVLVEKAYFGDLSHSEIAAETGLPLGTIKSRIRLALERLRRALD